MIAERTRPHLLAVFGAVGLLALSACSASEPYGARYDEDGYTYSHRQHGLYNDASYRAQRWRADDDRYRHSRAPAAYYIYDEDGNRRYAYRPSGTRYDYDDVRYGYRAPVVYYENGYRWYGYRQPSYRYHYDDDGYGGNRRD